MVDLLISPCVILHVRSECKCAVSVLSALKPSYSVCAWGVFLIGVISYRQMAAQLRKVRISIEGLKAAVPMHELFVVGDDTRHLLFGACSLMSRIIGTKITPPEGRRGKKMFASTT